MTLAAQMATDLGIFLEADDFGVSATYQKTGFADVTIEVIFDSEYFQSEYGVGVETETPFALAKENDLTNVAHGDGLIISSVTYKIRGIEPDGTGLVKLKLEKQ